MDPVARAPVTECRDSVARRKTMAARRLLLAALLGACGPSPTPTSAGPPPATATGVPCVSGQVAAHAPGVDAVLDAAAAWQSSADAGAADPILVDPQILAELADAAAAMPAGVRDPWSLGIDPAGALAQTAERLASYAEEAARGALIQTEPGALAQATADLARAATVDHARLVVEQSQLYCTPVAGALLHPPIDPDFDRNACTSLHPGELVRVLGRIDDRWLAVHAGHTLGWVHPGGLSVPLAESDRRAWRAGERLWSLRDDVITAGGVRVRLGVGLPVVEVAADHVQVRVATPSGPAADRVARDERVHVGFAPLRRAAVLDVALAQLGAPYGWGGRAGGRDCSQFLRDALAPFGVVLARHSSSQAAQGVRSLDVAGLSEADKLATIAEQARNGIVLLYMPGHIMLDLGERDGRRFALSSIAEFLVPCPDGTDALWKLNRVAVTDLEVGRGTSRGAFVERITRIAVFGPAT